MNTVHELIFNKRTKRLEDLTAADFRDNMESSLQKSAEKYFYSNLKDCYARSYEGRCSMGLPSSKILSEKVQELAKTKGFEVEKSNNVDGYFSIKW